jgi:hypothetical protein
MHLPLWAMGALLVGVLFDLPAFYLFMAVLLAGALVALTGGV